MNTENKENFDYTKIKSFEDACRHLGIEPELPDVIYLPEDMRLPVCANYKLLIIFKAINNGWRPDWGNSNQAKYFPWFGVLSSGSGFSDYGCDYDYSRSHVGSRLCTDSSDKALYVARTFDEEYVGCFLYPDK